MRLRIGRRVLAAAVLAPTGALAFEDAATGLRVNPPSPFATESQDGDSRVAVKVKITSTTGRPASADPGEDGLCRVNFRYRQSPNPTTKAELAKMVADPEWQAIAREAMEVRFDIDRTQLFRLQGYRGIEFQGRFTGQPAATSPRVFIALVDSVKGRTTMSCVTTRVEFAKALPQFRAIRSSITLPE